ncbi:MAG: DUF302 domain-containing protein [Rhizobiales bacterium]|nr:DUF302 domain-containing protein [Hyphomicrobiales bacterium]
MPMFRRLRLTLALAACLALPIAFGAAPSQADDGTVTLGPSAHDVATTADRMQAAIESKGAKVMARIDHAAGAQSAGLELAPTTLLIFGNPKLGTGLMQANPHIALELPLRALIWQDKDGKVWVTYNNPSYLQNRFAMSAQEETFKRMAGALNGFAGAAIAGQ